MADKILITSALPYANGPLHFGHIAGAYLPADCYARFERLQGKDVHYVCGSDEYGVAITISAENSKRTPKEHIDIFHKVNRNFFDHLNFSFDHYSRTSHEGHKKPVLEFFYDLKENGYIQSKVTDQLYSESEESFLADRYVLGTCPKCKFEEARGDECQKCGASYEAMDLISPRSKVTESPLVTKATRHWFLQFDQFKDRLMAWIEKKNWKPNVINFAKHYIEDLRERAITRDTYWGIPVPEEGAEGKVFYVWFDAPIGYISASQEWAENINDKDRWKDYWLDEKVKYVQFVGKDNIPFHAVFFPAMQMGQNQPYKIVDDLSANEFLNLEGRQFSKSDAWTVDLENFFKAYTPDQIRYALAANAPETSDSEFRWKDFQSYCNADLLGKYGNFVNRTLVFAARYCEGKMPAKGHLEELDREFIESLSRIQKEIAESYGTYHMRRASQQIMECAQLGNVYFDAKKPWVDAKSLTSKGGLEITIALCVECIRVMAVISSPIIPTTANKVWSLIGFEGNLENLNWNDSLSCEIPGGRIFPKPEILFRKVEDEEIERELAILEAVSKKITAKNEQSAELPALKPEISFDDFMKMDLRVGKIKAASVVPKSKKLLHLIVDIGLEERSIVSGISKKYKVEDLLNKKVVVVANLKPAKLMGIKSEGMVLAGSLDKALELVQIGDLPVGSIVS